MRKADKTPQKIYTLDQLDDLKKELKGKISSVVGGCFDVIHLGHVSFLEKAKEQSQLLIVLLESDEKIKKTKGDGRPLHDQQSRAKVLSSIQYVDFVLKLPYLTKGEEYDSIVKQISPQLIVTTVGDPQISYKQRTADVIHAKLITVPFIKNFSSSNLIKKSEL